MASVLDALTVDDLDHAVRIAELPDLVRGYEDLKLERVAEFRRRLTDDVRAVTGARGRR
jgi:indolepyruvate ferredoxin oxidoreductase